MPLHLACNHDLCAQLGLAMMVCMSSSACYAANIATVGMAIFSVQGATQGMDEADFLHLLSDCHLFTNK